MLKFGYENGDFMRDFLIQTAESQPMLAPILYILLQIFQTVLAPIPGGATGPLGGFLFGWKGVVWTVIGTGIGAGIVFFLSRRFGKKLVLKFVKDAEFEKFEKLLTGKGEAVFFLLFLLPGLPDDTVCYVAGLSKIPIPRLMFSFLIGRLPAIIVANYLGTGAGEGDLIKVGIGAGVSAVAIGIVVIFKEKILELIKKA